MKKRNEGYALPFVLVVMVVLCLVSVSILSFSLKNLQRQQESIDRTKAQYEAAGEIEKVVAQLGTTGDLPALLSGLGFELTAPSEKQEMHYSLPDNTELILSVTKNATTVSCKLTLTSTGSGYSYTYTSYEITSEGGADQ